ncbi:MAG: zinc ribbon-containing protein [Methylococcales bacterium]|nr:zinc ribbon-containing protein [Methylococcales bacterium]
MNTHKLITAYSDFMHHLHETMEDTLNSFTDAFETSKEKIGADHQLSDQELEHVSSQVHRDVHHAAQNLPAHDNDSLTEWLKFDIELIENLTWDAFLSVADKTRVELAEIEQHAITHKYNSGDITIAGTFECEDCKKHIAFKTTSRIPECPTCHNHSFVRV